MIHFPRVASLSLTQSVLSRREARIMKMISLAVKTCKTVGYNRFPSKGTVFPAITTHELTPMAQCPSSADHPLRFLLPLLCFAYFAEKLLRSAVLALEEVGKLGIGKRLYCRDGKY